MTPHFSDDWLTIYQGDVRDVLPTLPADSVDCIVTSPPYWGLRDYGESGQLGLERTPEEYVANMVAVFRELRRVLKPSGTCWLNLGDSYAGSPSGTPQRDSSNGVWQDSRGEQARRRGQYVDKDHYERIFGGGGLKSRGCHCGGPWPCDRKPTTGLKPKDLVGIPWRVAFALQADGWYLRSEVIWQKPNPMPESVTDRPTKSHEQIFLLTKSPTYYFDQEAVRESTQQGSQASVRAVRQGQGNGASQSDLASWESSGASLLLHGQGQGRDEAVPGVGEGESEPSARGPQASGGHADRQHFDGGGVGVDPGVTSRPVPLLRDGEAADDGSPRSDLNGRAAYSGERGGGVPELQQSARQSGRNLRSVWTIATRPYPGAHFAVFPPELPERCIKAGSSWGVCPECGAPWERVRQREGTYHSGTGGVQTRDGKSQPNINGRKRPPTELGVWSTTGWKSTCKYDRCRTAALSELAIPPLPWPDLVPAVVLDPFAGSGTTGMVANRLSRRAILIDLNADYLKQQMKRNAQTPLGLGAA